MSLRSLRCALTKYSGPHGEHDGKGLGKPGGFLIWQSRCLRPSWASPSSGKRGRALCREKSHILRAWSYPQEERAREGASPRPDIVHRAAGTTLPGQPFPPRLPGTSLCGAGLARPMSVLQPAHLVAPARGFRAQLGL